MSSPGVVYLSHCVIDNQDFRIEDNIGEAIHLHYGSVRIDFTISEFLEFADKAVSLMEVVIGIDNFRTADYDPIFLSQIADLLINLKEIKFGI